MSKLLNYSEVSRILTGSRNNIQRNRMAEEFKPIVSEVSNAVNKAAEKVFKKYGFDIKKHEKDV